MAVVTLIGVGRGCYANAPNHYDALFLKISNRSRDAIPFRIAARPAGSFPYLKNRRH